MLHCLWKTGEVYDRLRNAPVGHFIDVMTNGFGAMADYRQQVLVAFREVEDELSQLRSLDERSKAQARAVESAVRATTLSESRYRNGLVSQLDLLDAQRSELRSRRQAVQVGARGRRQQVRDPVDDRPAAGRLRVRREAEERDDAVDVD